MNSVYNNVNMITCDLNNCYVIRGKNGDILIDTGKNHRDEIEMWLHEYNIKIIVLTHGHNDHINNAKYLADLFNAKIAMSRHDLKLAKDNNLHKIHKIGIVGHFIYAVSTKTLDKNTDDFNVDIFLEDGMNIGTELGIDAYAVSLGGHTKGSFGILYNNDLYCGDALMNFISPSMPHLCESYKDSSVSLEKVKKINPERIFFGHGKPIKIKGNLKYIKCL